MEKKIIHGTIIFHTYIFLTYFVPLKQKYCKIIALCDTCCTELMKCFSYLYWIFLKSQNV